MVAILSERAIPDVRMTVDAFLEVDLPEGNRYELVDGAIEGSPIRDGIHDRAVFRSQSALTLYRRLRSGFRGPDLAERYEPVHLPGLHVEIGSLNG